MHTITQLDVSLLHMMQLPIAYQNNTNTLGPVSEQRASCCPPWGLGNHANVFLPDTLLHVQQVHGLTMRTSCRHAAVHRTPVPAGKPEPSIACLLEDAGSSGHFVWRTPCHDWGLCYGSPGIQWSDIKAAHGYFVKRGLMQLVPSRVFTSNETCIILKRGHAISALCSCTCWLVLPGCMLSTPSWPGAHL